MHTDQFEALLSARAATLRELQSLADLDQLTNGGIRSAVQRDGVTAWTNRCSAIRRYLAAGEAVRAATASIQAQRDDVAAQLARLSEQPAPTPGSRAWEQLASRVRELEGNLPQLGDLLIRAEMLDRANPNPVPVVEGARRAQRRLASVLVAIGAEQACASIAGAVDAHWIHALDVLRGFQSLEDLRRSVEAATGETVAAPVIVFPAREAWERITDREAPRIEWPATKAAA